MDEVAEVLSERVVELEADEAAGLEVTDRLIAVHCLLQLLARAAPATEEEWLN